MPPSVTETTSRPRHESRSTRRPHRPYNPVPKTAGPRPSEAFDESIERLVMRGLRHAEDTGFIEKLREL